MKNMQKGSANAVLVLLVLILAGALAYLIFVKKVVTLGSLIGTQSPAVQTATIDSPANGDSATQSPASNGLSVAGMKQYTDKDFGFSFWYPSGIKVTKDTKLVFTNDNIKDATVVANLKMGDIAIEEVHATTRTMTDQIANFGKVTYTFDVNQHAWMVSSENDTVQPAVITALAKADISQNTMGGLHMFPGVFPYNTVIIPLSADNFLVIDDEGGNANTVFFARTILATDPAVATPASLDIQTKTVKTEANALASIGPNTGMHTFSDLLHGFSFQYPTSINNKHESLGVPPAVFVTENKTNIDSNGCFIYYAYDRSNKGTQKTINGVKYCLTSSSDVGAGQLGTDYYYTTVHDGSYITLDYRVQGPNGCGAYDGADQQACQADLAKYTTTVIAPIEQSAGSLSFQ